MVLMTFGLLFLTELAKMCRNCLEFMGYRPVVTLLRSGGGFLEFKITKPWVVCCGI